MNQLLLFLLGFIVGFIVFKFVANYSVLEALIISFFASLLTFVIFRKREKK